MLALFGAMDVREVGWMLGETGVPDGSIFMDHYYAKIAREYLADTGATTSDLAKVSVKNRSHAHLNSLAQYREEFTEEHVLSSPLVADPLTKLMCSPLTDGAAALLVVSERARKRFSGPMIKVSASVIRSGKPGSTEDKPALARAALQAYEESGIPPEDIDLIEVHDASAVAELIAVEEATLLNKGDGIRDLRDGASWLGGRRPVNTSGGLLSRGHPGAATGASQLVELVWQLQGRCGERQVAGARHGFAHSSGGLVGNEPAATVATILSRV